MNVAFFFSSFQVQQPRGPASLLTLFRKKSNMMGIYEAGAFSCLIVCMGTAYICCVTTVLHFCIFSNGKEITIGQPRICEAFMYEKSYYFFFFPLRSRILLDSTSEKGPGVPVDRWRNDILVVLILNLFLLSLPYNAYLCPIPCDFLRN